MRFFVYGMWEDNDENQENPYDIFIGITAKTNNEADTKLKELVGSKAIQFELYDITDN